MFEKTQNLGNAFKAMQNQRGITLVGMVLSMVLLSIMGYAASTVFFQNVTAYNQINNSQSLLSDGNQAISVLKKDLADIASLDRISSNRIRYRDSNNELIEYTFFANSQQVIKRVIDRPAGFDPDDGSFRITDELASSDTLVTNISAFTLRYYDNNNDLINFNGTLRSPISNAILNTVTRIEINFNMIASANGGDVDYIVSVIPDALLYPDII